MKRTFGALALLSLSSGALANERGYSVTDFDRVRVSGPFRVSVETGKSPSARASGSADAIERVNLRVQGRTLVITPNRSAWGGWPGKNPQAATIRLSAPGLREASADGSATLTINRMKGLRIAVAQQGASVVTIGSVEADRIDVGVYGTGKLTIGGKAKIANATGRGVSSIDAAALATDDLTLGWESAGTANFAARRTAKVNSTGSGNVIIAGKPACTVTAVGAGEVDCGNN